LFLILFEKNRTGMVYDPNKKGRLFEAGLYDLANNRRDEI